MLSPQLRQPRVSAPHRSEQSHRDGDRSGSEQQVTPTQAAPPQQQHYAWSSSSLRLPDPFSPDGKSAVFRGGRSASTGAPLSVGGGVDVKRLVFDNLSALVWSTKHNRLLLENSSDAPEVSSPQASLYMSNASAEVFCEERRVVIERVLPRDMASVTMQPSQPGEQRWTVAIHGHARNAADDGSIDTTMHATRLVVRTLPNGVSVHRARQPDAVVPPSLDRTKRRHLSSAPTWSTVLLVCPSKTVATRVHDALEALRIQYIQAVPHGHLPEAREVEHAVVLQHRARECIARFGVRPDGIATAPARYDRQQNDAMAEQTTSPTGNRGGISKYKRLQHSADPFDSNNTNRRGASSQHPVRGLSLVTSIARSPQYNDASPAGDYEVLLGSSESESEADAAESISNSDDDAGFSSDDESGVGGEHSTVVRRVFQEPFVPIRSHIQELLNGGTWPPPPPPPLAIGGGDDRAEAHKHDTDVAPRTPQRQHQSTSAVTPGVYPERTQSTQSTDRVEETSPPRQQEAYEELLGSPRPSEATSRAPRPGGSGDPPRSPTVVVRPAPGAPAPTRADRQEPTATERRTHELIERLRTEILRAHAQRQERQNAPPLQEPTMMAPTVPVVPDMGGAEGSHEPYDRRASIANFKGPNIAPGDGSAARDADDDDSDASLEFHEEALQPQPTQFQPALQPQSQPAQQSGTPRKSLPPPKSGAARRVSLPISSVDRGDAAVVPAPPLRRVMTSTRSPPRGVPPEVRDHRTRQQEGDQILEAALGGGGQVSEERRTQPAAGARRSPVLASSRFQVEGVQDPWKIDRDDEHRSPLPRRVSNTTPIMKADRKPSVQIITPSQQRDTTPARHSSALRGASQESPRTSPSGRRCRWCKNVAPESHDDRCSLRKIKCKKCGSVLLLKERNAHTCTQTL